MPSQERCLVGVDPHKGSHTAVAVDASERSLAELRVRSGPKQLERLLKWAEQFLERTWAVENATGLGYLLAQQLVAAGERVLDVRPEIAATLYGTSRRNGDIGWVLHLPGVVDHVRAVLGDTAFDSCVRFGAAMDFSDAVSYAEQQLQLVDRSPVAPVEDVPPVG